MIIKKITKTVALSSLGLTILATSGYSDTYTFKDVGLSGIPDKAAALLNSGPAITKLADNLEHYDYLHLITGPSNLCLPTTPVYDCLSSPYIPQGVFINDNGSTFEADKKPDKDGAQIIDKETHTEVKPQTLVVQSCTFENTTDMNQNFSCGGYSHEVAHTNTASTTKSCNLGEKLSGKAGFNVGIASGEVQTTYSIDVNSSSTDTTSTSVTTTYSVPPQTIMVPPHTRAKVLLNFSLITSKGKFEYPAATFKNVNFSDLIIFALDPHTGVAVESEGLFPGAKFMSDMGLQPNDLDNVSKLKYNYDQNSFTLVSTADFEAEAGSDMNVKLEEEPLDDNKSSSNNSKSNVVSRGSSNSKIIDLGVVKPEVKVTKVSSKEKENSLANNALNNNNSSSFKSCGDIF